MLRVRRTAARKAILTRVSRIRRWWHQTQCGHLVTGSVMRDFTVREGAFIFYFRRSFHCAHCRKDWPTYR